MENERFYVPFDACEVRAMDGEGGTPVLTGYAAIFNALSEDLGGFREVIRPGAFTDTLARRDDVRALFNHDPNMILGRTSNGRLVLSEDERGLSMTLMLPNTTYANDLRESIRLRDVTQMSFGFIVRKENQRRDANDTGFLRELLQVDLFDVSPVTYPAYPSTTVSTRMREFIEQETKPETTPAPWRVQLSKRRLDLQTKEIS